MRKTIGLLLYIKHSVCRPGNLAENIIIVTVSFPQNINDGSSSFSQSFSLIINVA